MYRYETHLHTSPVSHCARFTVRQNLEYYKSLGYDGVFITNHFLDGNIGIDKSKPFKEKLDFYFSDVDEAKALSGEIGIKVFCGIEMSHHGTDFLVYGVDRDWLYAHPELLGMKKSESLPLLAETGALVIQAHPFREAKYIDHIRLYPRYVYGAEIVNTSCPESENEMARLYAERYGLAPFAGSDNHHAAERSNLAGLEFTTPLESEEDFVSRFKRGDYGIFRL